MQSGKTFLCIDGGTTNTRISLVQDGQARDTLRLAMGAGMRDVAALKAGIAKGIKTLLSRNDLCESEVDRILASGMITSEYGLCELPHISVPAGLEDIRQNVFETTLADVCAIPFVFIRGVKSETDMMRGEETELMGLLRRGECIYVLPGTHCKIISTDARGRITDFTTLMTGEMIAAISSHTILRDAIDLSVSQADPESLLRGYTYCCEHSIQAALFQIRALKNLQGYTPEQCYGFFMGAMLSGEVQTILRSCTPTVVIGGRAKLKEALAVILRAVCDKGIIVLDTDEVDSSVVRGMLAIYCK